MRKIKLMTTDQKHIYEGYHPTLNQAIEFAISRAIPLDHIDLSYRNMQHINLDGIRLVGGCFTGANLNGANMSECNFSECDFSNSDLSNACLCYSNINKCNFKYTLFSGADIAMASIENSYFKGFQSLYLNFHKAFRLHSLTFTHHDKAHLFSSPPSLIRCRGHEVAILDKVLVYKDEPHTFAHDLPPESIGNAPLKTIQSMVDLIKIIR